MIDLFQAMEAAQSLAVEHHQTKMEKCLGGNNYLPPPVYKMDSPPSYDDIANLHVAIPEETAVVSANNKQAEKADKAEAKKDEEPKV